MSETIEIQVFKRNQGRSHSRFLRKEKKVPAIIYGPKTNNALISIAELDAFKYSKQKFSNAILTLKSNDKELNGLKVLLKSLDIHPVSRRPIHIDYYAIDMTQTIRVNVKINFEGTAQGEKDGGVFNSIRRDIEIECLPIDIPNLFSVDISQLELNHSLTVADLKISTAYKLITPEDETIATVAQVKEEIEAPVAATEAVENSEKSTTDDSTEPPKEKEGSSAKDKDKDKDSDSKKSDKK